MQYQGLENYELHHPRRRRQRFLRHDFARGEQPTRQLVHNPELRFAHPRVRDQSLCPLARLLRQRHGQLPTHDRVIHPIQLAYP